MAKRDWVSKEHKIYRMPNGVVYCRVTIPGLGRRELSLGNKPQALKAMVNARDRKVADLIRAKQPKKAALWRFEDLAKEIMESKKNKANKTFISAELTFRKHLIPFFNERYPYLYEWSDRGETLWQEYIHFKRSENPNMKFLNHRKHLRMVLLRAFERRIIDRKVTLYNPDPEIDAGRVLEASEVKALYGVAPPILKSQILMAFTMGLRKSEILRLEWSRVDFETNEIVFFKRHTKTRKSRHVPMNLWVREDLERRYEKKTGPYVFPAPSNPFKHRDSNTSAWRTAKRKTGITARFHDLRHTFITNAVRAGTNPILISKYTGVSQDVMANVYCHLDTQDLRQLAETTGGKMGEVFHEKQPV